MTSSLDHALIVFFALSIRAGDGGSFGARDLSSITSLANAAREGLVFLRFDFFFFLDVTFLEGRALGLFRRDMLVLLAVGANSLDLRGFFPGFPVALPLP